MQVITQLAPRLVSCPEQAQAFLTQSQTLLRRALRLPRIRDDRDSILPESLSLCIIKDIGEMSLDTVHAAYVQTSSKFPDWPNISMDDLLPLYNGCWKHSASVLNPQSNSHNNTCTTKENALFTHCYLLFATSLLFSEKTARLLLTRVKEIGGDGDVVGRATIGLQPVLSFLKKRAIRSRHVFLICSDRKLMKACCESSALQVRLPKWVIDSIRDKRMKSAQLYIPEELRKTPVAETPNVALNSTPLKRKAPEFRAEIAMSTTRPNSDAKRLRTAAVSPIPIPSKVPNTSDAISPTRIQSFDQTAQKLFQSPPANQGSPSYPWRWACELRTSLSGCDFPMNDKICELLGLVQEFYSAKKDNFRAIGYQKAVAKIRSLDHEILTVDDAKALSSNRGFGDGLERKVIEIVKTGRLLQAEAVLQNADNIALKELCNVWGIGPVKAFGLISRGVKSIAILREAVKTNPSLLDRNQTIGLRLYEDLLKRIPRKCIEELEMYVRRKIKHIDDQLDITIAGSYLRGKPSCGDVDILVHGPDKVLRSGYEKLKLAMKKDGVLTDDLIDGDDKYFGIFRFPGRPHARIDLFYVPQEEFPFALLTYTGSAIFNRSMRAKARALGYSLSHKGLQRVERGKYSNSQVELPITVRNEREIFTLLDIAYVPPSLRSI